MRWSNHYHHSGSCDDEGTMALYGYLAHTGPHWTGNKNWVCTTDSVRSKDIVHASHFRNKRPNKWCAQGGTINSWVKTRSLNVSLGFQCSSQNTRKFLYVEVFTNILYMVNFSFTIKFQKQCVQTLNVVVLGYKIPFASTNNFRLTSLNFSIQTAFSGYKYLKSSLRILIKKYSPFGI